MPAPDCFRLPPLSALRAFEAAARLGGFSAAGRALNVTHAAVAQQVRGLEAELGAALLVRDGRGLALTPEGARLAAALSEGFAAIAAGIAALRRSEAGRGLRVGSTPAFAQTVLMPRLPAFWRLHPEVPVAIVPDIQLSDMVREGLDLAIRSGAGNWPGVEAELLMESRIVLVGAPALLGGRAPDPAGLAGLPWLFDPLDPRESGWLAGAGIDPEKVRRIEVGSGPTAILGAVSGYGLAFATDAVVRHDVEAGRLCIVDFPGLPRTRYWLATRPGPRRPALATFIGWLRGELVPPPG